MNKPLISIIVPGYNEEDIIAQSIKSIENAACSLQKPFEILIVDDGSKDSTLQIAKKIIEDNKPHNIRLVTYKDGPSRRENLAKSFKLLKGEYVILLDMDLSMDIQHMKDLIYWLEQGYDLVLASRYHPDSVIQRNVKRYIRSKLYNTFIRLLFRTGIKDNVCGFKAFKRQTALQLVEDAGIDHTQTRSVFWDTEIIIRARKRGKKIKEMPIRWNEGRKSALRFQREIKMVPYILKFWLKKDKKNSQKRV